MRIAGSDIQFASAHMRTQSLHRHVELRVTRPQPAAAPTRTAPPAHPVDEVDTAGAADAAADPGASPMMSLIKLLIEALVGHSIDLAQLHLRPAPSTAASDAPPRESAPPPAPEEGGAELHVREERSESEQTAVTAQGVVRTADGREIRFDLGLALSRSFTQSTALDVAVGAAAKARKDPLVINFAGTSAQLSSDRIDFDLDSDGTTESMAFVAGGSGFLALDRDGSGAIENGGELFGARSGDGFAELAALDADHNGWIDEADPAFAQLLVWDRSAGADRLRSLADAGVGAIHLGQVASAFEYRDGDNAPVAALRSTGIYLKESGEAGTVQQLDLFV
jgi:hypothetical protein